MKQLSPREVIVQLVGDTFGTGGEHADDILSALESAGYAVTSMTPDEPEVWVDYDPRPRNYKQCPKCKGDMVLTHHCGTPDEVLAAFAALPPTVRFKAVADGMYEFIDVALTRGPMGGTDFMRHADQIREKVAQWEAEDAATAEREQAVEELARHLYSVCETPDALAWDGNVYTGHRDRWIERARDLLGRFDITPKVKP